jgi:hypothetical protein
MVVVACRKTRPSLITGGVTEATPCVAASTARTCPALPALAITSTGSPDPAGECSASTFWAVIDGGVPRNDWATVSGPNLNPTRPSAPAPSRMAVTIHTVRGRRPMAWPARDHTPRLVGPAEP